MTGLISLAVGPVLRTLGWVFATDDGSCVVCNAAVAGRKASGGGRLVTFDQDAALETGSGADEGDQVGRVNGAPAFLGGLDELERHRQRGRPRSCAAVTLVRSRTMANVDSIGFVVCWSATRQRHAVLPRTSRTLSTRTRRRLGWLSWKPGAQHMS